MHRSRGCRGCSVSQGVQGTVGGAVQGSRRGCRGSGENCFVNAALIAATTYRSFHSIITTAVIVSIK